MFANNTLSDIISLLWLTGDLKHWVDKTGKLNHLDGCKQPNFYLHHSPQDAREEIKDFLAIINTERSSTVVLLGIINTSLACLQSFDTPKIHRWFQSLENLKTEIKHKTTCRESDNIA